MLLAPEDEFEDAQQELELVRLERQHEVRSVIFRAMQQMCICERIIMVYNLERDGDDRADARDIAWWLGYKVSDVQVMQVGLEAKLRGLLCHLIEGVV